jgi:formamidopyrimidine-DNA glycosylase
VRGVLADGLAKERSRVGGLSEPKLGGHFEIHGRTGTPCPRCGETLRRVSYDSYEVTYCPPCQTSDKVLADRRLSRLVK